VCQKVIQVAFLCVGYYLAVVCLCFQWADRCSVVFVRLVGSCWVLLVICVVFCAWMLCVLCLYFMCVVCILCVRTLEKNSKALINI